jgi:drug/metabolite transporter (DMT)-like permease
LGDILALAGALAASFYILIGRRLRTRISLISYIFVVYGMAAVVTVVLMFGSGNSPFGYPPTAYLWLLLIALIPQLLGHSTFNWALGYLSAAYVSIALIGEPIGSMILAYIFLDEIPTTMKIVGAILILTGIFIASLGEAERNADLSVAE